MHSRNDSARGALLMVAAMGAFVLNDAFIKLIGQTMPVGQLLFVRGAMTIGVIGLAMIALGTWRDLPFLLSKAVLLRAAADLVTTLLFITALINLPLANATAILQAVPFVVIVLAIVFLREHVGWRRLTAVGAGLIGVLFIIRPGTDGFNIYSLFAVGALLSISARDIITRNIPAHVPSSLIAFGNTLAVTLGGAALLPFETSVPIATANWIYLIISALLVSAAYALMVMTIRAADVVTTAPFRYSAILWSSLVGYLVLNEIPDSWAAAGIVIVTVSGVYALRREASLAQKQHTAPADDKESD